ncbi:hypothetical protein F1544_08165 [Kineosporiaceae bacterium B12]|nr:hypothetical protein [Kineococcus rubinsiae]
MGGSTTGTATGTAAGTAAVSATGATVAAEAAGTCAPTPRVRHAEPTAAVVSRTAWRRRGESSKAVARPLFGGSRPDRRGASARVRTSLRPPGGGRGRRLRTRLPSTSSAPGALTCRCGQRA